MPATPSRPSAPQELLEQLKITAAVFMAGPANDMGLSVPEPFFDAPLFGVAAGDDSLWNTYQGEAIGPFHWTPAEAFALAYPARPAQPDELSVLVWILPQTAATRRDNRRETRYPAERWARSRILGEPAVNGGLRTLLVDTLRGLGLDAVAPFTLPEWKKLPSERYTFASTWSERHAAFAAGLGTFGLSDGLITPLGKSIRVGSVVLRAKLPITPRPYTGIHDYCLYYLDGSCQECVKRCPVGSVSPAGRDKQLCAAQLLSTCGKYVTEQWGLSSTESSACGLCQTGVPCESGIPARIRRERGL